MQIQDQALFRQQCYIDGAWRDADDGSTIDVTNPADDQAIGTVPKMGASETRRAIEAANRALGPWRAKTAKERSQILRRWQDLMLENADDLATIMTNLEKLDKGGTVGLEELIVATLAQADALAKLLIEKGLITEAEFMQKLSEERAVYQTMSQKVSVGTRY